MKKNVKNKLIFALCGTSVALLAGCSNQMVKPSNEPLNNLNHVAQMTSMNTQSLAAIKTAELHQADTAKQWREFMFNLQAIPQSFGKKETFNFVGTLPEAIKGIAKLAGYKVYILGTPPAQPIMISVDSKDKPLINALRDVNAQAGNKADISLAPNAKLLTLTYNQEGA